MSTRRPTGPTWGDFLFLTFLYGIFTAIWFAETASEMIDRYKERPRDDEKDPDWP